MKLKITAPVIMFLSLCAANAQEKLPVTDITLANKTVIKAELAITEEQKNQGLMFREKLDKHTGMLFVNDTEDFHAMWMKNTWINLDFVYIGKDKQVKGLFRNISRTYKDTPDNKIPVVYFWGTYVLELPAGTINEEEIMQGDVLEFDITKTYEIGGGTKTVTQTATPTKAKENGIPQNPENNVAIKKENSTIKEIGAATTGKTTDAAAKNENLSNKNNGAKAKEENVLK